MPQPEIVEPWHGKAKGSLPDIDFEEIDMPKQEPDPLTVEGPLCADCWTYHRGDCA